MFTQTLTDARVLRLRPGRPAHRPARRRPLHRAGRRRPGRRARPAPRSSRCGAHTPRSVTLTLEPNAGVHAGIPRRPARQPHRRDRRPPAHPAATRRPAPRAARIIELTIGRHDGGLVSTYLFEHARPRHGRRPGRASAATSCCPTQRPRRILFVSGGSGITPVMSMLRTLRRRGLRPARSRSSTTPAAPRRPATATSSPRMPRRAGAARLHPRRRRTATSTATSAPSIWRRRCRTPDAVFVCGPPALVEAVREHCPDAHSESFVPPVFDVPAEAVGRPSHVRRQRHRRHRRRPPLLEQAEAAGLTPDKRMPDGHLPHLHPPQDQRRGAQPDHRRGLDRRRARTCRSACPSPSATSTLAL